MEANFWHQKWATNEINFHQSKPNPLLLKYFEALHCGRDSRIFVPLCGKSLDVDWLLSNGHRVAGAELSELAVAQLSQISSLSQASRTLAGCAATRRGILRCLSAISST